MLECLHAPNGTCETVQAPRVQLNMSLSDFSEAFLPEFLHLHAQALRERPNQRHLQPALGTAEPAGALIGVEDLREAIAAARAERDDALTAAAAAHADAERAQLREQMKASGTCCRGTSR